MLPCDGPLARQFQEGLQEQVGADFDLRGIGMFVDVVRDAPGARYEDHARRAVRREHLRIVSSTRRHASGLVAKLFGFARDKLDDFGCKIDRSKASQSAPLNTQAFARRRAFHKGKGAGLRCHRRVRQRTQSRSAPRERSCHRC